MRSLCLFAFLLASHIHAKDFRDLTWITNDQVRSFIEQARPQKYDMFTGKSPTQSEKSGSMIVIREINKELGLFVQSFAASSKEGDKLVTTKDISYFESQPPFRYVRGERKLIVTSASNPSKIIYKEDVEGNVAGNLFIQSSNFSDRPSQKITIEFPEGVPTLREELAPELLIMASPQEGDTLDSKVTNTFDLLEKTNEDALKLAVIPTPSHHEVTKIKGEDDKEYEVIGIEKNDEDLMQKTFYVYDSKAQWKSVRDSDFPFLEFRRTSMGEIEPMDLMKIYSGDSYVPEGPPPEDQVKKGRFYLKLGNNSRIPPEGLDQKIEGRKIILGKNIGKISKPVTADDLTGPEDDQIPARLFDSAKEYFGNYPTLKRAIALHGYMRTLVRYVKTDNGFSISDTLKRGEGDCNDMAVLLAAYFHRMQIPARVAVGMALDETGFGAHAWVEAYIDGEWKIFESTAAPAEAAVQLPFPYLKLGEIKSSTGAVIVEQFEHYQIEGDDQSDDGMLKAFLKKFLMPILPRSM